jgi:predicted O-methyltransferase YrrM
MRDRSWTAVDAYFERLLPAQDAALEGALRRSRKAGLPAIAVAPNQGRLLEILARATGRERFSKSGRWEATARYGWRVRWPRVAGW